MTSHALSQMPAHTVVTKSFTLSPYIRDVISGPNPVEKCLELFRNANICVVYYNIILLLLLLYIIIILLHYNYKLTLNVYSNDKYYIS